MVPPVARLTDPLGAEKLGVFVRLNTCARNSTTLLSVITKFLIRDISSWTSRSPRIIFLPAFPYVYSAGRTNVSAWFGSSDLQAGFDDVKYQQLRVCGSTGGAIESGRWLVPVFAR